jgi:uncharacterized membrane protein YdjX (TVP38/TMEM64 family)
MYRSNGRLPDPEPVRAATIVTTPAEDLSVPASRTAAGRFRFRRLLPLLVVTGLGILVLAMGWHRELSLETLIRHQATLDRFVMEHGPTAVAAFILLYVVVVALSLPGALYLTITSGILFGALVGALASIVGATLGATVLFLIAKTAFGEHLARRAGPLAERLAAGFRADAFSYLLFLRLVPVFPFFLVNLVPALAGVRLVPFVAATAIGIVPATFVFAFVGAGLDSALAAQEVMYRNCIASGRADCRLSFDLMAALTPEVIAALVGLGFLALVPVVVKRWRARRQTTGASG